MTARGRWSSPEDIDRCVAAAMEHRAAALARRATETMKRSDADGFSAEPVSRENLWCMETPQVFEISLLRDAYADCGGPRLVGDRRGFRRAGIRRAR